MPRKRCSAAVGRGAGRLGAAPVACAGVLGVLQLLDERVGLVAGELAAGLALGEPHRPAGVAEVGVAGVLEKPQELAHLLRRGRRTRLLTERHVAAVSRRAVTPARTVTRTTSSPSPLRQLVEPRGVAWQRPAGKG